MPIGAEKKPSDGVVDLVEMKGFEYTALGRATRAI